MKILGKLSLVAIAFAFCAQASAQSLKVKAGLNMASAPIEADGEEVGDPSTRLGFHIGALTELELSDGLNVETGLLLSQKGGKLEAFGGEAEGKPLYLEVPILLKKSIELGDMGVYGLFGPYVAYGMGGTSESDGESEDIDWGSDDDQSNPIDFGLNIGAGLQLTEEIDVSIQYSYGLGNVSNIDDVTQNNRNLMLSVGYSLF